MHLTEEQKAQIELTEEIFLEFIETMAAELYEGLDEDYELTEEEAIIAEEMMEHFVENFQHLSLKESATLAITGQEDPNQELFEEFIEAALDESVGGAVAGVVHGIKNMLSKRRANKAKKSVAGATKAHDKAWEKLTAAKKSAKGSTGIVGTFKKAKLAARQKKRDDAFSSQERAHAASGAASAAHKAGLKSRASLKKRIDTGIEKAKSKVKSAVSGAAHKVASVAGRVAGSL
jgi:hypothetical protein